MANKTEAAPPILNIKNVSKAFGSVYALDKVSLQVFPNEIIGVVGENGAGKTTLMKILAGVYPPDEGELEHRGVEIPFPKDPKDALKKGISIVYQEKGVVPSLKVYQFLFLGNEDRFTGKKGLQINKMKQQAHEILQEFHVRCDSEDFMFSLPLSTQKMVEVTKAILSIRLEQEDECADSVIILDEPTAPLTIEERGVLLEEISRLKGNCSFIFVTHIMQEVMECMDKVLVLRDGKAVARYDMKVEKVSENELTRMIIGKEMIVHRRKIEKQKSITTGRTVLSAENLTKNGCYHDISFDLRGGECIGVIGTAGSGKSELIKSIAGLEYFDSGNLSINGKEAKPRETSYARLNRGVGYFSGDLKNELFNNWSIAKNISILNIDKVSMKFLRVIRFKAEKNMAAGLINKLSIRAPNANTLVSTLSGGSKQKVTVGKWFEKTPDILLLENPTVGIDVGAREDIYETILEMKRQGISMILVGDDVKEYAVLCDRVLIIKQGRAKETINAERLNEVMKS